MKKEIKQLLIQANSTIIEALKQMDASKHKLLIVVDENNYHSILSIGDIQRAIISNVDMSTSISNILREEVKVASVNDDFIEIKKQMKNRRNEFMPVISSNNEVVDVIFWEELFDQSEKINPVNLNLPVVIMAGGKGSRLKPLTNVIPKPLIPINSKTIIEDIMDRFVENGCHRFYLSVNYKAELIRYYFDNLNNSKYSIEYFQEDKPLGTAGSLSLLKGKINQTFFVSNCDILIDQDYSEVLKYHRENKNEITIVAALKHYPIPYGIIETGTDGRLIELTEKPELTFKINSGMYVLEPQALSEIPNNQFIHITQLIEGLVKQGRRVGVFPVSEKSWKDIGEWNEYVKNIK